MPSRKTQKTGREKVSWNYEAYTLLSRAVFGANYADQTLVDPDPDEQYVLRASGTWIARILTRFPGLDHSALEFIIWYFTDHLEAIADFLTSVVSEKEAEDVRDSVADPGELTRLFRRRLSCADKPTRVLMSRAMVELIQAKLETLTEARRSPMAKSTRKLQRAFGLDDLERALFELLYLSSRWPPLEGYFVQHLSCSSPQGYKYLAAALGTTRREVVRLVQGELVRSGLVEQGKYGLSVSDAVGGELGDPFGELLPRGLYRRPPRERLGLEEHDLDPAVVSRALEILRAPGDAPIHLLLYGPAGTGKTTFARRLAQESGRVAVEVPPDEKDNQVKRRLGVMACLHLKNGGSGVTVLVDEADAMLGTAGAWSKRGDSQDKAWLNELLETSGSRMIWITNSTEDIDPSVLRRFAYSIRFVPFGRTQRARQWERILRRHRIKRFFDAAVIDDLARRYEVSAGVIDVAVSTAAATGARRRASLEDLVRGALDAHRALTASEGSLTERDGLDQDFSLDGLNVEGDLDALLARVDAFDRYLRAPATRRRYSMNILFHGAPGTGRSELARYIAHRLERELIVQRASDTFRPYVGMTEQGLAEAFHRAERDGAVLVIDEVDTLLFDREHALRSWEVSFTNEMLTQMERFRGLLIATTNRLEALDPASVRRFTEKLGFEALTPDGAVVFYLKMLEPLVGARLDDASSRRLRSLAGLTPGHFTNARDRWVFADRRPSHRDLLRDLEREASLSGAARGVRRLGF